MPRGNIGARGFVLTSSHFVRPSRQSCEPFLPLSTQTMSDENQANGENMRVDPQRAQVLAENAGSVLQKISGAAKSRQVSTQ